MVYKRFFGNSDDIGFMTGDDKAKLNGISDGYISKNDSRLTTPPVITNFGSAVAGNVVRLASAGALSLAQANSSANASPLVGAFDGTIPVPFSTQPIVKFDSLPVVGAPCYLSASVAGALTCTAPGVGYISVPQDLMVLEDKSVGSAYAARVGINKATTGSYSSRDDFKRYAAQLTGMNLAKAEFLGSDFTASELQDSGTGPMLPLWGEWADPCILSAEYSCILTSASNGVLRVRKAMPAYNLGSQRWALAARWRQDVAGYDLYFTMRRFGSNGTSVLEVGQFGFSAFVGHSSQLIFGAGNYDPSQAPWAALVAASTYGTVGVTWHQGLLYSKGDGSIYCNLDNTGEMSLPIAASAATGLCDFTLAGVSVQLDWLYLVNERVDY